MSIIATNNSVPQRDPIPEGMHLARCYQMIHVGTNEETIQGQIKILNKVRIGWELPNELHVYKEEMGAEPITLSKEYTLSMNEKANLRKDLKSWRGKDFTEEEARAFDVTVLIGVPCMLNIMHTKSKDGTRTYEEIAAIVPLMKGTEMPKPFNIPKVLSYDKFDETFFAALPEFITKKIETSQEYIAYKAAQGETAPEQEDHFNKNTGQEEDDDDQLPF